MGIEPTNLSHAVEIRDHGRVHIDGYLSGAFPYNAIPNARTYYPAVARIMGIQIPGRSYLGLMREIVE